MLTVALEDFVQLGCQVYHFSHEGRLTQYNAVSFVFTLVKVCAPFRLLALRVFAC